MSHTLQIVIQNIRYFVIALVPPRLYVPVHASHFLLCMLPRYHYRFVPFWLFYGYGSNLFSGLRLPHFLNIEASGVFYARSIDCSYLTKRELDNSFMLPALNLHLPSISHFVATSVTTGRTGVPKRSWVMLKDYSPEP